MVTLVHRIDFLRRRDLMKVLYSHALMNEKILHHRRVRLEGTDCFSIFFYLNSNHQAFFDEPVNRDEFQEYQEYQLH